MANTIKLGKRPAHFKATVVTFELPEGGEGQVEVKFKYRTRTEFGELIDKIFKAAGEEPKADGQFSLAELMGKTRDKNAEYLAECIYAWNLDVEPDLDNLRQLSDELPAAAVAIMNMYRQAATEGRLGN